MLLASCSILVPSLALSSAPRDDESGPIPAGAGPSHYYSRVKNRVTWSSFPLKVYFTRDSAYSEARRDLAIDGFDWWVSGTSGFVRYEVVDRPEAAQVIVRFDPSTVNGFTTIHFTNGRLTCADVMVGVKRRAGDDIRCTAAHEFGHALGIDGHSESRRDLMYPEHTLGTACRLTERDIATFAAAYPAFDHSGKTSAKVQ